MSSSIELLSLNELNIRRDNLIKLLKNTNHEIEKRQLKLVSKEKLLNREVAIKDPPESLKKLQGIQEEELITDIEPMDGSCEKLPKKLIKIKINISKSNK